MPSTPNFFQESDLSILGATTQTVMVPKGATWIVISNDDGAAVLTAVISGSSCKILAGEVRTFGGVEYAQQIVLSSDTNPTACRVASGTGDVPPQIAKLNGTTSTANLGNGAVTEVKLQAASTVDVLGAERSFIAVYDFNNNGGGVGNILFGPTLPARARVVRARCQVKTAFTGGAGAQVALGFLTDAPGGFRVAAVLNDATSIDLTSATIQNTLAVGTLITDLQLAATARQLACVVSVAALTAGRIVIHGTYEVMEA